MKRIRVLHPITRLIVGGAQENTMLTASLLDKIRFQIEVLCGPQTGSEGSLIEETKARGVSLTILPDLVRQISPINDLRALYQLSRYIRQGKFNIVHTHSSKAGILGRLAARQAGAPVTLHTVHGWSFHDHMTPVRRKTFILLERYAASICDALIAVTKLDIAKGLRAGIGREEQYRLIRSAIPLEEFDPAITNATTVRSEFNIQQDAVVIGNVGRFSSQKNPLDLVRVAGMLSRAFPKVHFLLTGDGPLRPRIENALVQEGIAKHTTLTGLRRDVPQIMAAMDIFMLTSLWEGLPRVLPQAMAMGIPVIANRVDGAIEAIRHGETGFLCTPGDLEEVVNYCAALIENPTLRDEMGEKGREFAKKEFDLARMINQIESLYEELLSKA